MTPPFGPPAREPYSAPQQQIKGPSISETCSCGASFATTSRYMSECLHAVKQWRQVHPCTRRSLDGKPPKV